MAEGARGESRGKGVLVSILTDSHAVEPHQKLLRLLNIGNNIVCHSLLSTEQLAALLLAPERADASVVQLDTFARLLVLATTATTTTTGTGASWRHMHISYKNTCRTVVEWLRAISSHSTVPSCFR